MVKVEPRKAWARYILERREYRTAEKLTGKNNKTKSENMGMKSMVTMRKPKQETLEGNHKNYRRKKKIAKTLKRDSKWTGLS